MPPSSARCEGPAVLSITGNSLLCPRKKWAANTSSRADIDRQTIRSYKCGEQKKCLAVNSSRGEARTQALALKYLAAERSEDGASGRYTTPRCSEWCQNHCSNHSGFLTGADTFVRTTLLAMAPGGHAISERLSFGYFSLARQRKVTAAPRRGDANRPTRLQVLRDTGSRPQRSEESPKIPTRRSHPPCPGGQNQNLPIEPVAIPQDACVTLT